MNLWGLNYAVGWPDTGFTARSKERKLNCLFGSSIEYTLQEHQKFRTETEISLISNLLKTIGGIFLGFFP